MNNFVFNQQGVPLYISNSTSNQTLNTNGNIFTICISDISLLLDIYNSIELSNPKNSRKTFYISNFTILTSILNIKIKISFIKNGTLNSGSLVTPINNNFLSNNSEIYSVDSGSYSLLSNETLLIKLNNPENSTKTLFLEQLTITSSSSTLSLQIALYKNG